MIQGVCCHFQDSGRAGDRYVTHRCPGEWITVEQMKTIVRLMLGEMRYEIPPQDLGIDVARIPALPASGLVVANLAIRDAGGFV